MSTNHRNQLQRRNGRASVKHGANNQAMRTHRKGKRKRKRKRKQSIVPRALFVFGSFTALIFIAVLVFGHQGSGLNDGLDIDTNATTSGTANPTATPEVTPTATDPVTPSPEPTNDSALLAEMLFAQEMLDDPLMVFVSVNSLMSDDYVVNEVLADSNTGKTLAAEAATPYMAMVSAAADDDITLRLQSAYRSVSYQAGLFEKQVEKWEAQGYQSEEAKTQAATVVNPPGASEHGCGLAADINCPDFWELEEGFEDTTAFAWLNEHAVEYGFILRYTKEDQETTGITYEPWHWRYVGAQNATIIKESGLCLEDFLEELTLVANGTATSDVITGTAAWQATVGTVDHTSSTTDATENMKYEEALKAGLDPEALGLAP